MKVGCKCTNEACDFYSTRTRPVDATPCCRCGSLVTECSQTRGKKRGDTDAPLAERFWRHVDKNGSIPTHVPELGPCWMWTAHIADNGYGRLRDERKRPRAAHVLSFTLAYGPVPDGKEVAHKCDNRACVRPTHLFPATHQENLADMRAKGRAHYQQGVVCGEPKKDGTPCQIPTRVCRYHRRKERAA